MGMTIYPAYLYKDNATMEDVEKLITELAEMKEKFVPYLVKQMLDKKGFVRGFITSRFFPDAETTFKRGWIYHDTSFRDEMKQETESWERGMFLDIMCNAVIYFHDNKIVVQAFEGTLAEGFFKKYFKHPDYSYYDIWVCGRVSKKKSEEFSNRKSFYDSIFVKSGIPSNVGFTFDFNSEGCIYDIEDQVLDGLFGKDWERPFKEKIDEMRKDIPSFNDFLKMELNLSDEKIKSINRTMQSEDFKEMMKKLNPKDPMIKNLLRIADIVKNYPKEQNNEGN